MAYKRSINEPQPVTAAACIHLRNKSMYVTGDRKSLDTSATPHCWCVLTQHVRGPDQQDVDRESCVPGRDCYREC
jgi:hypothetical protein